MNFPVHNWQFWVVTAIFAGAAAWVLTRLWRFLRSATGKRKGVSTRVGLTVKGRPRGRH